MKNIIHNLLIIIKSNKLINIFLIVGLVIASMLISVCISYITEVFHFQKNIIDNMPPNSIVVHSRANTNNINLKNLYNSLNEMKVNTSVISTIYFANLDADKVNTYYELNGIWFNKKTTWKYPIKDGKYFSVNDVNKMNKVALIGSNLKKFIHIKNKENYISIFGEEYKVIGILGYENRKSHLDGRIVIPLNTLPSPIDQNIISGNFPLIFFNENSNIESDIIDFSNNMKKHYNEFEITLEQVVLESSFAYVKKNIDTLFFIAILGYIITLIYSINIIIYWVETRKYEFGLRKLLGYTNFKNFRLIFFETAFLVTIAYIFALLVQTILNFFQSNFFGYNILLYKENLIIAIPVIFFTTIFITSIPMIIIYKIKPINIVLKEDSKWKF